MIKKYMKNPAYVSLNCYHKIFFLLAIVQQARRILRACMMMFALGLVLLLAEQNAPVAKKAFLEKGFGQIHDRRHIGQILLATV